MKPARVAILSLIIATFLLTASCSGGFGGTYSNGSAMLEFRSGGKVVLTFMGESKTCAYKKDGTKVSITCPGEAEPVELVIHDDGSLTGGWMGIFRKTEKS